MKLFCWKYVEFNVFLFSKVDFLLLFSSHKFDNNVKGVCLIVLSHTDFLTSSVEIFMVFYCVWLTVICDCHDSQLMNRHRVWRQFWALLFQIKDLKRYETLLLWIQSKHAYVMVKTLIMHTRTINSVMSRLKTMLKFKALRFLL